MRNWWSDHEIVPQRGEEAFRHRVVPAVARAARAGDDPGGGERGAIREDRVLTAPIRVLQEADRRLPRDRSPDRCHRELRLERRTDAQPTTLRLAGQ